ncbi:MAG TPA: SGNH/GDSL hydrolase family protein [Actinocrinis sp.]|jgi:lysophospholipase L1-like esterase
MRTNRVLKSRRVWVIAAATLLSSSAAASWAVSASSPGGAGRDTAGWVASYEASEVAPASLVTGPCAASTGLNDQTVRNIVYSTVGGDEVRVRLSNVFGDAPLQVGHASVAVSDSSGDVVSHTMTPLTFGGSASVVVPPFADELSDPVRLAVPALHDLAVSVFVPAASGAPTQHWDTQQTNFVASGDAALSTSTTPFSTQISCSLFVSGVDVRSTGPVTGSIVAFGDSITDGYQSTNNANHRWPDFLARDLAATPGNQLSVVNAGISGDELTTDRTPSVFGVGAQARIDRDVLTQTGARDVVLLEGINDIGASSATAAQVIAVDKQIIEEAHAAGLKIYGGTLTPFGGSNAQYGGNYGTAAGETQREAVNAWIRTNGAFDGVIDFDKVTRDPADPQILLPAYDADHLHPNDAGYQAMAQAAYAVLTGH